jgi:hypothetical protein
LVAAALRLRDLSPHAVDENLRSAAWDAIEACGVEPLEYTSDSQTLEAADVQNLLG